MGHATSWLAVAHNDMAVAWAWQGEWEKSIVELKESRSVRESLPGFTPDKLFSPLYHLGLVYAYQGKYDEAEKVLNETIGIWEDAYGPIDTVSLRSAALFYTRGQVKFSRADSRRQDIRGSLSDYKEAVTRATKIAGPRNRSTLICKYQLAKVYAKLGEPKVASYLLDEVLSNTLDKEQYQRDIARTAFLFIRTTATLAEEDIATLIPYDMMQ
ncbi:hypothetical protein VTL71DRAFT_2520 [Oculimacula yallundae]|uniref:MalT-like TPR region domain-containing protein n=1 Tax=Oculimacula yallundae TaxID=86028 RepID=A0ABR4C999_9HELO